MKRSGRESIRRILLGRRLAVGLALLAIVVSGASVTAFIIRPARATTPHTVATQRSSKKERDDPRAAGQYFQLRHYGAQLPAADASMKALQQAKQLPQYSTRRGAANKSTSASSASLSSDPSATWTPLGPQPIDSTVCSNPDPNLANCSGPYGNNTGSVTALAVDPTDSNILWVGSADGGLWRSTDGGNSYTPLSDSWQTLAIGSITIDPNNHDTVYVGTGDANFSGDGYWGVGIYKTTNGNEATPTWTQLGFSKFGGMSIAKLSVDPNNSANILAAVAVNGGNSAFGTTPPGGASSWTTNSGIWRSRDGGNTWNQVLSDASSLKLDFGTDVLFDPALPGVAFAALGNVFGYANISSYTSIAGIYKSSDYGATWSRISGSGAPSGQRLGRISLALSADGAKLYSAIADTGIGSGVYGQLYFGIWISRNITNAPNAITFGSYNLPTNLYEDDGNYQYWYNLYIAVDPNYPAVLPDDNGIIYIGGGDLWKCSLNESATCANTTWAYNDAATRNVHPNQHALAFISNPSSPFSAFYAGNDGGIWKNDGGSPTHFEGNWTNLNDSLNITQFYGGSYGDVGGASGTLYGGAQGNGELQFTGTTLSGPNTWNEVVGNSGGYTVVDYTDNHIVYGEFPNGGIYKSTDGGANWAMAVNGISGTDDVNFIPPLIMWSGLHTQLLTGTDRVYLSTDSAANWTDISGKLDTSTSGFSAEVSALAMSPIYGGVIYAGTNGGKIYHTTTGPGPSWSGGSIPGSTGGVLTSIAVDPTNPNIVYATFANFASGAGHHVFKSTDFGMHWTDISASLPNVPFESILVNPQYSGLVIAGSDAGVFASTDGGSSWYTLGEGLPNVAINQIFTSHDGSKLFVATHGRGMWVLSTASLLVTPATPVSATVGVNSFSGSYNVAVFAVSNAGFAPMTYSLDTSDMPSCLSLWGPPWGPPSFTLNPGQHVDVVMNVDTTTPGMCAFNATFTANGLVPAVTIPIAVEVSNLSTQWYFAEGYTGKGFDEWLTLANPGGTAANVTTTYLIQGSSTPIIKHYTVNARSRFTIKVNGEVGQKSVSMAISSTLPIIAERPMYVLYGLGKTTVPGGTSLMGSTTLQQDYYFGYLDTTANHDTWFTVLNQNSSTLNMTIDYYKSDTGVKTEVTHTVPANSRGSFKVNDEVGLAAGTYSAHIHFDQPALVERPMYFKDSSSNRPGVTDVLGVNAPQTQWYFADGQADSNHREVYILSNQNTSAANYTLTFYNADGTTTTSSGSILAGQQVPIPVNTIAGITAQHGAAVTADQGILVDRYISQHYVGPLGTSTANSTVDGATDSTGTSTLGQAYYFAEGYTGGKSAEFLELANPDATHNATVTVSYLPSNGSAAVLRVYTVPAHSRLTITTSTVMKGASFSMAVLADRGIVAERTMEFIYGLGSTNVPGANVAVGFQP